MNLKFTVSFSRKLDATVWTSFLMLSLISGTINIWSGQSHSKYKHLLTAMAGGAQCHLRTLVGWRWKTAEVLAVQQPGELLF